MTNDIRKLYTEYLEIPVDYGSGPRLQIRQPSKFTMLQSSTKRDGYVDLETVDVDRIYLASDHHFDHKNIIKYANRPFTDVGVMNQTMIDRHNEVVGPDDICILGGDIAFSSTQKADAILERMNGYKICIIGNHDFHKGQLKQYNVDEMHLFQTATIGDVDMVFTHYPLSNLPEDVYCVHGHIHDVVAPSPRHFNYSVEQIDYRPIPLSEVITTAKDAL